MDLLPTIEDVSPDTSSKADYSNSISTALQPPPSVVLDYVDDYEVSQNWLVIIVKVDMKPDICKVKKILKGSLASSTFTFSENSNYGLKS